MNDSLDRNGYAPSIMGNDNRCFICSRTGPLQRHEVFHGAFRNKSKRYGLWISVCPACHHRIHNSDGVLDKRLKAAGQREAMTVYGWDTAEFRRQFGKNYLEE